MPIKKKLNRRRWLLQAPKKYWQKNWWHKLLVVFGVTVLLLLGSMYGLAEWYIHKHRHEPLVLGTTFIAGYAESYHEDPHQTLQAILSDLGIRHLRLVSYWDQIEPKPGVYDFSQLDWQFALANQYHAKVSLAIGLRQPRWPECHPPSWIKGETEAQWLPQLNSFTTAVINHYKNNPTLESYQLENEYFLGAFGDCGDYSADRPRLISEFNNVKAADKTHPVIMSLANNYIGIPTGQPVPDEYGISIYKRVFDYTVTHRYFEYPFPPWYYAARSGLIELVDGKPSVVHEMQAEPWGPVPITDMSIAEQDRSMNATSLTERIKYAEDGGYRTIDMWGAEWWYWRKTQLHDPSLWNAVKTAVQQSANR